MLVYIQRAAARRRATKLIIITETTARRCGGLASADSENYRGLAACSHQPAPIRCNLWRRSVVKYGVRVSQVKPSNCFGRLEKKTVLPSILDTSLSSLMMWNLQSYPRTVLNERMCHFRGRGSKHTLTPPTYFQRDMTPNPLLQLARPWRLRSLFLCLQSFANNSLYLSSFRRHLKTFLFSFY